VLHKQVSPDGLCSVCGGPRSFVRRADLQQLLRRMKDASGDLRIYIQEQSHFLRQETSETFEPKKRHSVVAFDFYNSLLPEVGQQQQVGQRRQLEPSIAQSLDLGLFTMGSLSF